MWRRPAPMPGCSAERPEDRLDHGRQLIERGAEHHDVVLAQRRAPRRPAGAAARRAAPRPVGSLRAPHGTGCCRRPNLPPRRRRAAASSREVVLESVQQRRDHAAPGPRAVDGSLDGRSTPCRHAVANRTDVSRCRRPHDRSSGCSTRSASGLGHPESRRSPGASRCSAACTATGATARRGRGAARVRRPPPRRGRGSRRRRGAPTGRTWPGGRQIQLQRALVESGDQ